MAISEKGAPVNLSDEERSSGKEVNDQIEGPIAGGQLLDDPDAGLSEEERAAIVRNNTTHITTRLC